MSRKRSQSTVLEPSPPSIFTSSPILDRSSKFIAYYSPTLSTVEISELEDLASASHRIAAWRKPSKQTTLTSQRVLETGHDDDGEKYGGKTVARVLDEIDVEGTVLVARWYGGVMLEPVRFDHIRNCAAEAISRCRDESEKIAKKAKIVNDAKRRDELVRLLPERDRSITVLRGLLAGKSDTPSSQNVSQAANTKVPDYEKLPLPTLGKLEQVRDATIGWILKQIEKAENRGDGIAAVPTAPQEDEQPAAKSSEVAPRATSQRETPKIATGAAQCEEPGPREPSTYAPPIA